MKPEIVAPAGSLEKMETALIFGADAVYFGLPDFSLRARINQFKLAELKKGAEKCRQLKKKFYLTFNIYAHQRHLKLINKYWSLVRKLQPNAIIISDPGLLALAKKHLPNIPIHLSTQANVTNAEAAKFWHQQGVKRIILARELNLEEIKKIKKAVPKLEIEIFGHGAMCMAYSGRCILSQWMARRSANLGDCAQPCRWKYNFFAAESQTGTESQTGEEEITTKNVKTAVFWDDQERFEMIVEEDQQGTYLFNSYDLCLIGQLDKIIRAGVSAVKIEGRNKSAYYAAITTRSYRRALKAAAKFTKGKINKKEYEAVIKREKRELASLSHRGYWTGFLLGKEPPQLQNRSCKKSPWLFVGISHQENENVDNTRCVFVHNVVKKGEIVTLIQPHGNIQAKIKAIKNSAGKEITAAHGGGETTYLITFSRIIKGNFLMRKKIMSIK